MKTLILYATKHGAARDIAERIAKKISGATLHDLKKGGAPALSEFDCVIVGSSIYVGTIRKEAKSFLSQNADDLKSKKLGLFLCGMEPKQEQECFKSNFSQDILQAAKATVFPGGIYDPKKVGVAERFIMKVVAKMSGYTDSVDDGKIAHFVKKMKE